MSENKNTEVLETQDSEKTVKSNGWLKNFIWVMIGVIVGILLGYAVFSATLSTVVNETTITSETEVETGDASDSISTYKYEHTVLSGDDLTKAVDRVNNVIDYIANNNTYVQVQVGENEFESYIYNDNGECFAQSSDASYHAIFRNDGNTVKYSSESNAIAFGKDIDILQILRNGINATKNNSDDIDLFEMLPADENATSIEYRVDLRGEDAIKQIYCSLGDEFAETMFNNLVENIPEWDPHLILVYIINDTNETPEFNAYCLYVEDNTEYTNWILQGFFNIGSWKLSDNWYNTDYTNINADNYTLLVDELIEDIKALLDKYIEENTDIVEGTEELGDTAETTEAETTEAMEFTESTEVKDAVD